MGHVQGSEKRLSFNAAVRDAGRRAAWGHGVVYGGRFIRLQKRGIDWTEQLCRA